MDNSHSQHRIHDAANKGKTQMSDMECLVTIQCQLLSTKSDLSDDNKASIYSEDINLIGLDETT